MILSTLLKHILILPLGYSGFKLMKRLLTSVSTYAFFESEDKHAFIGIVIFYALSPSLPNPVLARKDSKSIHYASINEHFLESNLNSCITKFGNFHALKTFGWEEMRVC